MDEKATISKDVGIFRVSFYPGLARTFAVIRAWRIGVHPTVIRTSPYPSWQLFEGENDVAREMYNCLIDENEIERLCVSMRRSSMITRAEEIVEYRANYSEDAPQKKKRGCECGT